MSIKKKLAFKTLIGGIILNIIITTYHIPSNLFKYFYLYLRYVNENIYTYEKVEVILSLSNIIYFLFIFLGIILNFKFNTNSIVGISLLLRIFSIYLLMNCSTNNIFFWYLLTKCSSSGLCFLPILSEIWKYFPNNKGLITGIFFLGKGLNKLFYESISIKIINPKKLNIMRNDNIYLFEINENYYNYLKILIIFFCLLGSVIQSLIYPHFIYINYINYKKNKFKEKLNKGLLKNFYILSNKKNINSIGSNNNKENLDEVKNFKNSKEPFISLITSYPFLQLSFIYFLIMFFNSIDIFSINIFGLYNNFNKKFLSISKVIWSMSYIVWNIISGYFIDKIRFKKLLIILLIFQIFLTPFYYLIVKNLYGFILFNIINSIIDSTNNIIIPFSFGFVFGDETGLLLYGISSIVINTFYIYRSYIYYILREDIYFLLLCLISTIFNMFALITLCLFEEKKHIYRIEDENKEYFMFNDLKGEELNDIDICDEKEFVKI